MQIDLFYISQRSHESFREFELFCTNLNHTFTFYLNNLEKNEFISCPLSGQLKFK